ncbi:MAG: phytanoyl-CoA dioxygenase family protein [Candidatus Binatia bacterium]
MAAPPSDWIDPIDRHFRAKGWARGVVAFDADTLAPIRAEIEALWAQRRAGSRDAFATHRPELPRLHRLSPTLGAFVRHPVLIALAQRIIGPNVDMLWNQAHCKGPGGHGLGRYPWHQDGFYAPVEPTGGYSCWIALTPTRADNGAIAGVTRSDDRRLRPHTWNPELAYYVCEVADDEVDVLEMALGEFLLFDNMWPHASGPNTTDAPRIGYSLSYAHTGTRLIATGETYGDRVPVVRDGRAIDEVMAELARDPSSPGPGRRALEELTGRMPEIADLIAARFAAYRDAVLADDTARAERTLTELICSAPDEAIVLGDLLRSRGVPDELRRELRDLGTRDLTARRLLLGRLLELDPGDDDARRELAALDARTTAGPFDAG